ncbi:hypothetical protein JCM17846_24290 [Iodidimonas nitroreducens]|uniref:Co-chaperone DjlA N-terminal domain-containing protein n=1 Tax=Iodidimonas nitroreducens TaxID=1236968 RepID=A0A5A7N9Y2_9PROT|nr:tellurite resistance TerB family protein [Iodidimonas nitroreducens]GAK34290.1 tellurite resistance protein TerB [alpha proteobacterium Q-1]GER04747.1 hypothetical protein JCM17846_24290 [Iodidimonas nitroreducens]
MSTISPQTALVYAMVLVSASDRQMTDSELRRIGDLVRALPAFDGYDENSLVDDAKSCAEILDDDEGLDAVFGLIAEAIPASHSDLIYALGCEIAAADGALTQEELRLLEMLRHRFAVDRLTAAAIERGVAARRKSFEIKG